uniref:Secreted protein n=1 Tax=Globodera pallida TaxID=36090 RepID=A0A183BQS6_GLOPA
MAPLPTLFALLCSVAVLLVLCDGKIFTDANDNDLYKERQRPAKTSQSYQMITPDQASGSSMFTLNRSLFSVCAGKNAPA